MKLETFLLRQVHPDFVNCGRITSQVFRPTFKDDGKLSVDDGDKTTAEAAFKNYTECRNLRSAGVVAVTLGECEKLQLSVSPDPIECVPSHALMDFSSLSRGQKRSAAKKLRKYANDRGWQYRPE